MKRIFTLQNIFLFFIIVVLPVFVAYYAINNMIEEQYIAQRENMTQDLRQQIARVELAYSPEYQIRDFFTTLVKQKQLCRKSDEVIKWFIEDVNNKYPNAFKWLFVDSNYELRDIKSSRILEGKKAWQGAFHGGVYIYNCLLQGISPNNESAKEWQDYCNAKPIIQKMTGSSDKAEHIFEKKSTVVATTWFGKTD